MTAVEITLIIVGIIFLLVLPIDIGFTTDCFCAYTALDSI